MQTQIKPCELYTLIPKEKIDQIFLKSETAGAELDYEFLGFEEVYKAVTLFVPKNRVIIDFGCGYAFQSWYFRDYRKYIGVDVGSGCEDVLKILEVGNSDFYRISIQEFIDNRVRKDSFGFHHIIISATETERIENVFAICSYVPSTEAQRLVRETFPHCLVYYPHRS